jgi:DNA-binding transcriptional MocR family regulator
VVVHYQVGGGTAAEISASVEDGIRSGALATGSALPPVRGLAQRLGVSPATVASAYRGLRDRGLVETAGRGGTRVRTRPPVAARLTRLLPPPPGAVDLSAGEPDPDLLPPLGPRVRRVAAHPGATYRSAGPVPELVEAARVRLAGDGVPVRGAGLTVTGGALDGIERVLAAHLRPGDRVAVEDPGWANLLDLVAALGLRPVPLPVDDDGPTPDGLHAALAAGAGAVVVTSRAQNPTGAAVGAGRARELRRILRTRPDVLVVEDDHAAELAEVPLHPLAGTTSCWAFVRSVSKPYGPDLRTAVLAGDEATVARVEGRLRLGTGWVSTLLQRTVVELWRDPAVARIVDRARAQYAARRDGLRESLAAHGIAAHGRTGINVWVPVTDETAVVARLRERGYAVAPGSLYRLASAPAVRVTVSPLRTVREVGAAAREIARAVSSPGGRGRSA